MSNSLAIAAVTSSIRFVIDQSLQQTQAGPVGGAHVVTRRPDELTATELTEDPAINVYCYLATPNHAWNLTDLPTRRANGSLVSRPVAALDLHYLISCVGKEPELEAQRLLGRVVGALAATSVLTRDVVTDALERYAAETETAFLEGSDLAEEVELVKLAPATLSLEEMSKLWSVLDTPYLLSLTYLATVVLIAADLTPTLALPVRQRSLTVTSAGRPRIASVETDPPSAPPEHGTTLVVRGAGLAGPGTAVRVGPALLPVAAGGTAEELRVVLDDDVPAGLHALQVVHRAAAGPGGAPPSRLVARSNAVPLLVRPSVVVSGVDATDVTLTISPPLQAGQRLTVMLGRLEDGAPNDPDAVTLEQAPVAAADAPQATVEIARADVPDGRWLVRVQVDGVDSIPDLVGETYDEPDVVLPPP
jgi:Pvc16 N-terminal domain